MSSALPQLAPADAPEAARTAPFRSRLFSAIIALTVTGVALFVADLAGLVRWSFPVGQVTNSVLVVLAVLMCRRAATDPASSARARRVWWLTSWGMSLIAASIGTRLLASTAMPAVAPVGNVLQGIGAVVLAWSVFRIPLRPRTRAQSVALALDVATLLVAAATVVWHFFGGQPRSAGPTPSRPGPSTRGPSRPWWEASGRGSAS